MNDVDRSRNPLAETTVALGYACRLLQSMQEFWRNNTPVYAGSELAEETGVFLTRVMEGPPFVDQDAPLTPALAPAGAGVGQIALLPTFDPMKFADTVRRYFDGDGERFAFTDRTGHVHGEYRNGCAASPTPENAIGAVKIGDAWHWVVSMPSGR